MNAMLKMALAMVVIGMVACGGCIGDAPPTYTCPSSRPEPANGFVGVPLSLFSADGAALTARCGIPVWRFEGGHRIVSAHLATPPGCYVRSAIIVAGGAPGRMVSQIVDADGRQLGVYDMTSRDGGARDIGLRAIPPSNPDVGEFMEVLSYDAGQELHSALVSFACGS